MRQLLYVPFNMYCIHDNDHATI